MNTWNPFLEADPEIKITYTGPESGKGARYEWTGNSKVGQGSIEIQSMWRRQSRGRAHSSTCSSRGGPPTGPCSRCSEWPRAPT